MKGSTVERQSNDVFLSCSFQTMRTKIEHDQTVVNSPKPSCDELSVRTRWSNICSEPD